ncbi:glutamate--cysteine ligase, partial [Ameyamaea chiangmaiensis]
MSNPGDLNDTRLQSCAQLVSVFADAVKPRAHWRIGTEHEKFGFVLPDDADSGRTPFAPPPYAPRGIGDLLGAFDAQGDGERWSGIVDQGHLIGLKGIGPRKGGSISLEPAGQFELSGAPLASLHDTRAEMAQHFDDLRSPAAALGLGFAPLGFQPLSTQAAMPIMPKSRYAIMRAYMPKVGTRGLDMMTRTCTVQVNLDYGSEADMRRKMRVSLALQPLATALFANSPFYEGAPNGLMSNRAQVWTDTDNQRSGMPRFFFDEDFGFERYIDWLIDVPMYFVMRDGRMIDVAGRSFRDWLAGRPQPGLEGLTPTIGDFEDHMTTVFTDVRLKQFLEMRGADAGSPEMMLAQSALWVGLLYDDAALTAAEALVRESAPEDYIALRAAVPAQGMGAAW